MTDGRATDGEWLTYLEVAARLGVSVEAVRAMARRGGWPKQRANGIGQVVRVQVPPDLPTNGRPDGATSGPPLAATGGPPMVAPVIREAIKTAVEGVVGPLRDELERITVRAERAERQVAVLRAKLMAARLAGEMVRVEMDGLRERLDRVLAPPRKRGWWPWRSR